MIGSRWVPGGAVVNWPLRREALSVAATSTCGLLLGHAGPRRHGRLPALPRGRRWRRSTSRPCGPPATASRPTWPTAPCRPGSGSSRCRSSSSSGCAATPRCPARWPGSPSSAITAWGLRERRRQVRRLVRQARRLPARTAALRQHAGVSRVGAVRRLRGRAPGRDLRADPGRPGHRRVVDDRSCCSPTRILGSWLVRREGGRAWQALTRRCSPAHAGPRAGRRRADPGRRHPDAHAGFVTDVVGLFVILPFTRPLARAAADPRGHPRTWSVVGTPGAAARRAAPDARHPGPGSEAPWSGARSSTSRREG